MTGLLLDHLWQSTLFAAAAALLALALHRNDAQVRYWVWFAAAAKFLVPFAAIAWTVGQLAGHLHAQAPVPPRLELARQVLEPMTAPGPVRGIRSLGPAPFDLRAWLVLAWLLGTGGVLSWRGAQWRALREALAGAAPLPLPIALPAFVGRGKGGPAVVGFLRSVLVLPHGLAERLTPAELEAVLEHELCHARRQDNLLTLPLLLAQALFWFHPVVWWLGRRLLAERERACDEAVLDGGIDPETYARGLLKVCRLALEPAPALAAAATGGATLKRRVRRIMAAHAPRPLGAGGGGLLTAAVSAAVAAPVLAGVFTAEPAARALAGLAHPLAAVVLARPSAPERTEPAPPLRTSSPAPLRITLVSAPAVLPDSAYRPQAPQPMRLARRVAVPVFQAEAPEAPATVAAAAADVLQPSADAQFLRALADRTAYVTGADLGSGRLELRAAACPTAGVMDAERRLGGEAISTAFDGRVRRFVEDSLAGKPHNLSPAMAEAVDRTLPALQPALAARFGGSGAVRLIGEDRQGRDVYLARLGAAGYALVLIDDLGQVEAALFCAG